MITFSDPVIRFLKTIRYKILSIPAYLEKKGNKNVLRLMRTMNQRQAFLGLCYVRNLVPDTRILFVIAFAFFRFIKCTSRHSGGRAFLFPLLSNPAF